MTKRICCGTGAAVAAALWLLFLGPGCAGQDRTPGRDPVADETGPGADFNVGDRLVTGRSIDPNAARGAQDVGSLPMNMALSPDGRFAVTTGQGYRQFLWSIDAGSGKGVGRLPFPRTSMHPAQGLYYGVAVAPSGEVYAAQGAADSVAVLKLGADGKLARQSSWPTQPGDFPAGLALDDRGNVYVTNNDPTPAGPTSGARASVAVYTAAGEALGRFTFESDLPGSNFPLSIAVLRDGSKCYVASQRDGAVYVLNTSDPKQPKLLAKLETGSHPDALCLDKAGRRLFVANAHSDTVSVVDTTSDKVTATVLLRPDIAKHLAGATPTGLALSGDERTLYATLGDMNAVAVIDLDDNPPELKGYLPAGWYPSAVVAPRGADHILVANAKGSVTRYENPKPDAKDKTKPVSPNSLIEGNVSVVSLPKDGEAMRAATEKVLELNRLSPRHARFIHDNPLKSIGLQAGKIRHVIYIVKENRTYDQVLGDLPQGNGDAGRCIFGRAITPNQHALAERFVLMDNFYDSGEVSGDGWTWSTQAQANEYTVRNVPYQYSDRGRDFDYEGQVNDYPVGGFPAKGPDGKPLSEHPDFREGAKAIPDVAAAPGGHLWDLAHKAGLTVRNYGFFVSNGVKGKKGETVIPDNYPNDKGLQPGGHDLGGVTSVDFRRFDMDYPDSDATWRLYQETKDEHFLYKRRAFGKYDAHSRFEAWNREFRQMLAKDPSGGAVPNLMLVRFCVDHTAGLNPGHHSPKSMVADNDYAVGQLVEAVSRSPIWKSTAIFIIEDDAQNGPDHVDAHRSTCYVISPWIKKGSVDHTFHNTVSVLKTMELLLGLPPMCQYDAVAAPIMNWDFSGPSNGEPFAAIMPDRELFRDRNPLQGQQLPVSPEAKATIERMMEQSMAMDFANADKAPAELLNQIMWSSVRGWDSIIPPTPRGPAGLSGRQEEDEDD